MGKSIYQLTVLGILASLFFAGCPWFNSPNLFDTANYGGPPKQTEPPLVDEETANESQRAGRDPF